MVKLYVRSNQKDRSADINAGETAEKVEYSLEYSCSRRETASRNSAIGRKKRKISQWSTRNVFLTFFTKV